MFIVSHLLRLGYNAAPLPIDTGVDLLAHWTTRSGESRVAQFQVKTTRSRRLSFSVTKKRLERWWSEGVNLIVVFWYDPTSPFSVVLPPSLLYMLTTGGYKYPTAPIVVGKTGARIVIGSQGPRMSFVRNRQNDVSAMVDRFDRLEATDGDPNFQPSYASFVSDGKRVIEIDP